MLSPVYTAQKLWMKVFILSENAQKLHIKKRHGLNFT